MPLGGYRDADLPMHFCKHAIHNLEWSQCRDMLRNRLHEVAATFKHTDILFSYCL